MNLIVRLLLIIYFYTQVASTEDVTSTNYVINISVTSPAVFGNVTFPLNSITTTQNQSATITSTAHAAPARLTTDQGKDDVTGSKVPNPQVGVYIVVIFLAVVGAIVVGWLVYVIIIKRNRRSNYSDPSQGLRGSTSGIGQPEDFENPIDFSSSQYSNQMI
uniref:Uncharacterized LOC100186404 n=1 Tax=Ciona intestinalis TaxID=7719 RepID=H2XZ22_CIOIN|nr:uncharacterized protein LOC100186404 [Ciona intestinalis]|eukprot:XP_002131908.1 uncharacterized protein LOC100186404 [Ciona intestinalis]